MKRSAKARRLPAAKAIHRVIRKVLDRDETMNPRGGVAYTAVSLSKVSILEAPSS